MVKEDIYFKKGKHNLSKVTLTLAQKIWIGTSAATNTLMPKSLSNRLKISVKTIYKYRKAVKEKAYMQSGPGKPILLGENEGKEVQNIIWEKEQNDDVVKVTAMKGILLQASVKTAADSNHTIPLDISDKTVKRMMIKNGLVEREVQQTTVARKAAEGDVMHAISYIAALNFLRNEGVTPMMYFNNDKTQLEGNEKPKSSTKGVVVRDKEHRARYDTPIKTAAVDGVKDMALFNALTPCVNGAGMKASFQILFADSRVPEGECWWYKIKGGNYDQTAIEDEGHIVFCNSRSGNAAYHKAFNENVILPFIEKCRILTGNPNAVAAWQSDGEKVQIDVFQDPSMRVKIGSKVHVLKGAPSATAVNQQLDASSCFRDGKNFNKSGKVDPKCENKFLSANIETALHKHEENIKATGNKKWSAEQRKKIRDTYAKSLCIMESVLTKEKIIGGFKRVGAISSDGTMVGETNQVLSQFNVKVKLNEMVDIQDRLPSTYRALTKTGNLTDKEIMEFEVVKRGIQNKTVRTDQKPRDERALNENRCCFLLHAAVVEKEEDRSAARREAAAASAARKIERERIAAIPQAVKDAQEKALKDAKDKKKADEKAARDDANKKKVDAKATRDIASQKKKEDEQKKKEETAAAKERAKEERRKAEKTNPPKERTKRNLEEAEDVNVCKTFGCNKIWTPKALGWTGCENCEVAWFCGDCAGSCDQHQIVCVKNSKKCKF